MGLFQKFKRTIFPYIGDYETALQSGKHADVERALSKHNITLEDITHQNTTLQDITFSILSDDLQNHHKMMTFIEGLGGADITTYDSFKSFMEQEFPDFNAFANETNLLESYSKDKQSAVGKQHLSACIDTFIADKVLEYTHENISYDGHGAIGNVSGQTAKMTDAVNRMVLENNPDLAKELLDNKRAKNDIAGAQYDFNFSDWVPGYAAKRLIQAEKKAETFTQNEGHVTLNEGDAKIGAFYAANFNQAEFNSFIDNYHSTYYDAIKNAAEKIEDKRAAQGFVEKYGSLSNKMHIFDEKAFTDHASDETKARFLEAVVTKNYSDGRYFDEDIANLIIQNMKTEDGEITPLSQKAFDLVNLHQQHFMQPSEHERIKVEIEEIRNGNALFIEKYLGTADELINRLYLDKCTIDDNYSQPVADLVDHLSFDDNDQPTKAREIIINTLLNGLDAMTESEKPIDVRETGSFWSNFSDAIEAVTDPDVAEDKDTLNALYNTQVRLHENNIKILEQTRDRCTQGNRFEQLRHTEDRLIKENGYLKAVKSVINELNGETSTVNHLEPGM